MTDTMVTTREVPWMKLGKLVDNVMTSTEAAHATGLDFTVSLRDIRYNGSTIEGYTSYLDAPKRKMVCADDTNEPFDVVSADYKLFQYADAFAFLDEINPEFVAAGLLKGRRQGFMVVRMPNVELNEFLTMHDPHELFITIRTSHDRSRGIEVACMPLRQKCMNQLTLASFAKNAPQRWSIKHVGNIKDRMHEAKKTLLNAQGYAAAIGEQAEKLAKIELTVTQGEQILKHVIRSSPKQEEAIAKVIGVWQTDDTVGFTDRAWGLVNAVSSYFDWERAGGTAESRFLGALEGQTVKAIQKVQLHALRAA